MAILLEQFVQNDPGFFGREDITQPVKTQVYNQAARHLIRDSNHDILSKKRPFETEEYQKYRDDNRRNLTYDPIWQFEKLLIKALQRTNFSMEELPKLLQDNLESQPYHFMDRSVDLDTWVRSVLVPYSMLDPNAITVELPMNPANKFIPPIALPEDGGVSQSDPLVVKTKIVNHANWFSFKDPDILVVAERGKYPVTKSDGTVEWHDYFFMADYEDWYIYYPTGFDKDGLLIYSLDKWYPHEFGSLPYGTMPGVSVMSAKGFYYRESFVRPYFEYADEFESRFEDDQVVHTRYAYPREIVSGTKCTTCKGSGKQAYKKPYTGEISERVCMTCDGSGMEASTSISGRVIRPESVLNRDTKEPVSFVTPDTDILAHTTENAFFFLEEARKILGLNALAEISESGEAKKIRQQNKIDKLLSFAYAIIGWKEQHLNLKQHIFLFKGDIKRIKLTFPVAIAIKGEDALREEVDNSLPIDRYSTILKYIQEKYSNDVSKQKIHSLALLYAPLLALRESEIALRMKQQAYDRFDIIRADKAVYALTKLKETNTPLFLSDKIDEILVAVEEIVRPFFPTTTAAIAEPQIV